MNRDEIRELVNKLITNLNLTTPIDFDVFFSNFKDLKIRYGNSNLDVDGRITLDNSEGNYIVELRGDGKSNRDRFTIAHELGHLFLGHVNQYETLYRRGANELEYAANEFAADLLMPEADFRRVVNENLDENSECDIEKVSEIFQVSESAVLTRGRFLGLFAW
ncbi:ImmA/IrrE family metallo-endopeptidase [Streptococcus ferus]|uniref:Zn peptidase n=1 Tax=Streptococcus ferus TaxID=1345 RepID=A0A2X3VUK9_9STRE|nr:ImmA/IrrE family metallo-endopeptidase [Streptococcus ferus]SQF38949.1 Zn peptidase [Streptococcus ferus]